MVSEKEATTPATAVSQLPDYELVLVIKPDLAEGKFEATLDSLNRLITGKGGVVTSTDKWGKKKLAYPIKKASEGNYVLIKFQSKPAFTKELEANLRISEDVLRHLLVRVGS